MDKESKLKRMATPTQVHSLKVKSKEMVSKPKRLETNMTASGSTTGIMARATLLLEMEFNISMVNSLKVPKSKVLGF